MHPTSPDLDALATAWQQAKDTETAAAHQRRQIEGQIVALTGCRDEGSQTHTAEHWKITITGRINRTLDREKWSEIRDQIPPHLRPVKESLDDAGVKWLRDNEPDLYSLIAQAVTAKPGKPGVQIKPVEAK